MKAVCIVTFCSVLTPQEHHVITRLLDQKRWIFSWTCASVRGYSLIDKPGPGTAARVHVKSSTFSSVLFQSFMISIIVKICMQTKRGREKDVTKYKRKETNLKMKPLRDYMWSVTEREHADMQEKQARQDHKGQSLHTYCDGDRKHASVMCFRWSFGELNRCEWRKTLQKGSLIIYIEENIWVIKYLH